MVLTNPDTEVQHAHSYKTDQHNPTFVGIDTLIKYYKSRLGNHALAKLQPEEVKKVAAKLLSQTEVPPVKAFKIPDYDILENLTRTPHKIELLARQTGNEFQTIKRLRVFPVDPTASQEERKAQRNKAVNSLKALEQIKDHPNVIR